MHTESKGHLSIGSGEDFYGGWSCDQESLNKFSFLQALKALHEIQFQLVQRHLSKYETYVKKGQKNGPDLW